MVMDENMSVIHIIGSHYLYTAQIKTD